LNTSNFDFTSLGFFTGVVALFAISSKVKVVCILCSRELLLAIGVKDRFDRFRISELFSDK